MDDQPRLYELLPPWGKVLAAVAIVGPLLVLAISLAAGEHVMGGGFGIALHLLTPVVVATSLFGLRGRPRP